MTQSPELKLFRAVITRAIEDAMYDGLYKYKIFDKREALSWLTSNSIDFKCICHFADIDSDTFCISVEALEKELKKKKIDVVIVVHMSGHPANLDKIYQLKKNYNFKLIEDACHAIGAFYKDTKI